MLPPASVDRGTNPRLECIGDHPPAHVAGLGHHRYGVLVLGNNRPPLEAHPISGLKNHLHRRVRAGPQVLSEAGRCHQDEVGGIAGIEVEGLRMAHHPHDVALTGAPAHRCQSVYH